jgi:uncharacterized protein (TIGR03086 family)
MEDPRVLHRRAGENAADIIARIPAGRLGDPTPCSEWAVRDVINHMVNGNLRFAALVTGEPLPEHGDDVLGDDPLAAFRDSADQLCAAFDREGVLDQTFPTPFGEGPGTMLVSMRTCELSIHSWDLAAATGQPRDLDPDLVAFAESMFRARPLPRGGPSPFGPEQPVPDGATAADRLAAYVGRTVPPGP